MHVMDCGTKGSGGDSGPYLEGQEKFAQKWFHSFPLKAMRIPESRSGSELYVALLFDLQTPVAKFSVVGSFQLLNSTVLISYPLLVIVLSFDSLLLLHAFFWLIAL